ncbi:DNA replication factor C, large subunit [Clavulina sp. PMI_390]|nr:DNA replication factor C, large subunit [Clavulina sp. PMI_390]
MPPKVKSDASVKDIRAFFGGSGADRPSQQSGSQKQAPTKPSAGNSPAKPIELSDSDDDKRKKNSKPNEPAKVAPKPAAAPTTLKRKSNVLLSSDSEEDAPVPSKPAPSASSSRPPVGKAPPPIKVTPKAASTSKAPAPKSKKARISSSSEDDDDDPFEPSSDEKGKGKASSAKSPAKPRTSSVSKAPAPKRRVIDDDDESEAEETEEDEKPKKKSKVAGPSKPAAPRKSTTATPAKRAAPKDSGDAKPKPAPKTADASAKPKPKWAPKPAAGAPAAAGTKAVSEDADPNALAGLTFVFTGELSAFSRDEAMEMAKRFGGRVTGSPSGKTDYVVLGSDAGPKKLEMIKKLNLKTLDEDGFLNLIATRKGVLDKKQLEKLAKEEKKLKAEAAELGKRDKEAQSNGIDPSTQLWTTRYAPQNLKDIVGNKSNAEKIQAWLHDWPGSLKCGFKKPGANGLNTFRAILISGPPGIGKTTSAHVAAKLEGYTPIEVNASDARSKKLVENSTNISNTSLDGWMGGKSDEATTVAGFRITDNSVLIMDEVDGMSGGDRGGVGALNALIKKTRIPIICIANDRRSQKIKPLLSTCYNMPFTKPTAQHIRSRLMTIALREKIKIAPNVIDALIEGANSDIRQVLTMLSTWKLSHDDMNFDEGKKLARENQKHMIMTPYTILDRLLGPYTFSETSRETLNDKMDYYFQDHSFVPLFVQENYAKTTPAKLRKYPEGPEMEMKHLELLDRAAASISDGDMVDTMIHQQTQWSLMPLHAIHSTVKPASLMYGMGLGYGYKAQAVSFPSWLGQNSKQGKLQRQLSEVQIRMRLKVSGDKMEIRQSYIPALFPKIVMPLMEKGSGADEVTDVIECMDEYFVSKDDWDTIIELGVGDYAQDFVMKKIPGATKSLLTKRYNASEHPIPFHKGTDFGTKVKKIAKSDMPDQEDVLDNEDDIADEEPEDVAANESDYDVSKDKLIKESKPKPAKSKGGGGGAAGSGKASTSKAKK